MASRSKTMKTKKPARAKGVTKESPATFVEAARRRRQRVLRPVNRDPFLAMMSSRKTSRCKRLTRRGSFVPSDPCRVEMKVEIESPPSCSDAGRPVHPYLIDVGGGMMSNVVLAERLPEKLQRPDIREASPEKIAKAGHDAECALRSLEMIRRDLVRNGKLLYSAVTNTAAWPLNGMHTSELPEFATIRTPQTIVPKHMPSHILAVYSNHPEVKFRKLHLTPIHASILAAHCCRVPRLPNPRPPSPSFVPAEVESQYNICDVPLVPFAIPSAESFPIIQHFLYTQDAACLFRTLVPVGPSSGGMWDGDFSRLSDVLTQTFTSASLVSGALRVYSVWQNACSLGVMNPAVWQVIDVAWKAHRDAILFARR